MVSHMLVNQISSSPSSTLFLLCHSFCIRSLPLSALFTMLFLQSLSMLLTAAILPIGFANADEQIPLGRHAHKKTITSTIHITRTRYDFRFATKTLTRPATTPTLSAPWLAQLHQKQRKENCDETACAMCKLSYQCDGSMSSW